MDAEDEEEEFVFSTNPCKHSSNVVSNKWILLDNQSTIKMVSSRHSLSKWEVCTTVWYWIINSNH